MEKIKLDIQGNTTIPTEKWEDGWDMITTLSDAVKDGVISDDSAMNGTVTVPVCSKSEKKRVEDEFSIEIDTDSMGLLQFEDKEVCKVIAENAGDGNLVSKENFEKITDIKTWFNGNTGIERFDELGETGVTLLRSAAFSNCTNLKYIDLSNIIEIQTHDVFLNTNLKIAFAPNATSVGGEAFESKAVFLPNVVSVGTSRSGMSINKGSGHEINDYGKKVTTLNNYPGRGAKICIIRNLHPENVSVLSLNSRANMYFVPQESISGYLSGCFSLIESLNVVYPISGTEWQTEMRSLADKYAAEYAGWSDSQIANADYSDPYIDYDIFGVPRPTE